MDLWLAVGLSALWLFLSGGVEYSLVLPRWLKKNFGNITREQKDTPVWAVASEKLLQGLGLALLVSWTTVSLVQLSIIPLLLISATYLLLTYANYKVAFKPVLVLTVIDAARVLVALYIVGLILR